MRTIRRHLRHLLPAVLVAALLVTALSPAAFAIRGDDVWIEEEQQPEAPEDPGDPGDGPEDDPDPEDPQQPEDPADPEDADDPEQPEPVDDPEEQDEPEAPVDDRDTDAGTPVVADDPDVVRATPTFTG